LKTNYNQIVLNGKYCIKIQKWQIIGKSPPKKKIDKFPEGQVRTLALDYQKINQETSFEDYTIFITGLCSSQLIMKKTHNLHANLIVKINLRLLKH